MIEHGLAASRYKRERDRLNTVVLGICLLAAVGAGLLAGILAEANKLMALPAFGVLVFPFVAWRRPTAAVSGLGVLAIVVEQYRIGVPSGDFTDHIPLFTSLSDAFKLSGVYVNPIEILFGIVLLVYLIKAGERQLRLPGTALSKGIAIVFGLVLAGAVHGLVTGGDYKMTLWEIRPLVYVSVMYFFATQLPARAETVTATLWVFVVGVAFKAVQGLLLLPAFLSSNPRPDYILSHEDSFFFVLFIVLAGALWLFQKKGRLRTVVTALLPLILVANLANNRRTSWAILGAAVVALAVMVWVRMPNRRRAIAVLGVTAAMAGAVYLPLYWDRTGLLAGPAEAVRSQFAPDVRQNNSDLYRKQENANLQFNIERSPLIGLGYGVPIRYALPMFVDLTSTDPFLKYIPHDGVLYVWMRLGAVGALAFWSMIGLACIRACRLLRSHDPGLAAYGAFVVCALIAYVILGYLDLGFFWFRIAVTMGWLLGIVEIASRVQKEEEAEQAGLEEVATVEDGSSPAPRWRPDPAPRPGRSGGVST